MNRLIFYAKYPFVHKDNPLRELLSNLELTDELIEYAGNLLFTYITGLDPITRKPVKLKLTPYDVLTEKELTREIITYPLFRMILVGMDNSYYTGKFADRFAKRTVRYLRKDESEGVDLSLLFEDLNLHFVRENDEYKIHYTEYVSVAPNTREDCLSNQRLFKGFVYLDHVRREGLIEHAIRKRVERLPKRELPEIIRVYSQDLAKRIESVMPKQYQTPKGKGIPPCIQRILDRLKAHENLSHIERWVLAVFLNKRGVSRDSIVRIFSNTPNFNLKMTEYQVDYVIKKNYAMPSCASMKSYGLCVSECNIRSPLMYRESKTKGSNLSEAKKEKKVKDVSRSGEGVQGNLSVKDSLSGKK